MFTNRSIQHEIRLAEGETNILGGIITDVESVSLTGIPGLKDIPILKYLFAQEKKASRATEIIIMLTPHIVRMPNIPRSTCVASTRARKQIPRLRSSPCRAALEWHCNLDSGLRDTPRPAVCLPGACQQDTPRSATGSPAPIGREAAPDERTVTFAPSPITLSADGPTTGEHRGER